MAEAYLIFQKGLTDQTGEIDQTNQIDWRSRVDKIKDIELFVL